MLVQDIYLEKYDWCVRIYYAVDRYYTNDIVEDLISIDCDDKELVDIIKHLDDFTYNTGFTYSNPKNRNTIIVIGLTTSALEFQDTFDHEKGHLAMHICLTEKIDPFSEEYQYLVGSIGKKMFPVAKLFLCDHCYKELRK